MSFLIISVTLHPAVDTKVCSFEEADDVAENWRCRRRKQNNYDE